MHVFRNVQYLIILPTWSYSSMGTSCMGLRLNRVPTVLGEKNPGAF